MKKTTKKKTTKKAATKRKRNAKKPTAKQLAARRKFAAAARARAKAAKTRKNTSTKKRAVKRTSAKATKKRATKKRNKTIIKKAKKVIVLNPKKKAATKKRVTKKRNSSSTAIDNRKEFAGKYTGDLTLHFPQKSLTGLSTLGPLVSLQGEFGTIKPVRGGVYYCQDAKGRIHIGAKSNDDLWAHVKENLGQVRRVEYRAAKPHLGYPQVITWFHDFEAPYPVLKSDGKGGLTQVGGGYKIRREGIVG